MAEIELAELPRRELAGQGGDYPTEWVALDRDKTTGTRVAELVLNILLSVSLFAVFVAAFFFLVASQIEEAAVKSNTTRVVGELMGSVSAVLEGDVKAQAHQALEEHLVAPDMAAEDRRVAESNRRLMAQTWLVLGVLFAAGVAVVLLVWGVMKWRAGPHGRSGAEFPDLKHLVLENLILLGFVGLTEFVFLLVVGAHYRSLDANKIRSHALRTVRDFIGNRL